jgi:Tryptophan-associated transmembrane protein (Trp_oprn_chp)
MTRRPLWMVAGALAGAAVALWASSRLAWTTELVRHPGTDVTTTISHGGAESKPLVPLAVLALAGVAAAVASTGWPRRVLGAVLGLAGFGAFAMSVGTSDFFPWGRILAGVGGVLMMVAAAVLVRFGGRMPRLGTAYRRPDTAAPVEDSDHAMWRALSLGKDPTTDEG